MANVSLWGASYSNVPAITVPQTGGGTVTFYENGGGADCPTFTIEDDGNTLTVSCDKTYSECRSYITTQDNRVAIANLGNNTGGAGGYVAVGASGYAESSSVTYFVDNGDGLIVYEITYTSSTITISNNPSCYEVLNATSNGTYTPQNGWAYSAVNVNVPGGGISVVETQDSHGGTIVTITGEVIVDGDNLEYGGGAIVGSAIVGTATAQ